MIRTYSEEVYVEKVNNFGTAIVDGVFPASASFKWVGDYERFAFIIHAGTLNSALTCQVKQDTGATQTGGIKNVTGATVTVGAGDDNESFIIEVETRRLDLNNGFDYVTLDVAGAAGGDDFLCITFLGINPGSAPVTQPATTNTPVIVAG